MRGVSVFKLEEGATLVRPYCLDDDGSSWGKVRLQLLTLAVTTYCTTISNSQMLFAYTGI
jgi:hypothetical protein